MKFRIMVLMAVLGPWIVIACGKPAEPVHEELRRYPLNSLEGVLTRSLVVLDQEVTSDGGGSLRISTPQPTTIRLFEVEGLDVEDARLSYRAKLKTKDIEGQVYLEMWCVFPGRGEYFSRGLHAPLSGTVDWSTHEIPFLLEKGQQPELIKLNLVIDGRGTVWIDDIVLSKG